MKGHSTFFLGLHVPQLGGFAEADPILGQHLHRVRSAR
ncbi:unnamed protein product, partial [Larinioides sclopetarius]